MFYTQCWKCGERWNLGTASTCTCEPEQSQRPWVGLTNEEIDKTLRVYEQDYGWISFAKAIEAKLKEKNTSGQE